MVLDYGLIKSQDALLSANYRSAGSHQSESINAVTQSVAGVWVTICTVPSDKTYYVTGIWASTSGATNETMLATGSAGSETMFASFLNGQNYAPSCVQVSPLTPIKFSSGTRIASKITAAVNTTTTLVGWEE